MHNNPLSQQASSLKSSTSDLRKQSVELCSFEGFLKRESVLFSNWKSVVLTLIQSPHVELLLTYRKQKQTKIEEIINITYSRLSKRLTKVDKYYSFGVIAPSNKKYLFAGRSEEQSLQIYSKIINLRNEIKKKNQQLGPETNFNGTQKELIYDESHEDSLPHKTSPHDLLFEKCNVDKEEQEQYFSTNAQTPKRQREEFINNNYPRERQRQAESFCTAMEDIQKGELQDRSGLHLQQAISAEQVACLQSDEGFKLLYNFGEGRFLAKGSEYLKASLLLSTSLGPQGLLESFFHLELWNSKVKHYSVLNRIDKGIYLVKLQLHRKNLFSLPRYCYMMANTSIVDGDYVLVFRSLDQSHFDRQFGYNWLKMDMWVRARQCGEQLQRLMNICAKFGSEKDFEGGMMLMEEIKIYQMFLKTTCQLPHPILEWNEEGREIQHV